MGMPSSLSPQQQQPRTTLVAAFADRNEAEIAVDELQQAGFRASDIGFAIRGSGMFEGFRGSVDYYDIDLSNAIATLTPQFSST